MNKIHVNVFALQVLNALPAGLLHLTVLIVPHLGHDKEILSLHHALAERLREDFSDLVLILIA